MTMEKVPFRGKPKSWWHKDWSGTLDKCPLSVFESWHQCFDYVKPFSLCVVKSSWKLFSLYLIKFKLLVHWPTEPLYLMRSWTKVIRLVMVINWNGNDISELSASSDYLDPSFLIMRPYAVPFLWSWLWFNTDSWSDYETSHTVSLKDKTLLLGSLYTSWGSHHFRHDTHTFVSHSSRVLTWPPLCIIHRALYTHGFVALGVCHIPFLPVTLHRFKTDNLTILPASYVTPGTWWEMTDWKSSRRLILWKVWQGLLGFFPSSLATALLAGRSLSFRL